MRKRNFFIYSFFALIILLSVGVSAYSLFSQSIRLDEAQSIWIATRPVDGILRYVLSDVHVPLYEILLHFWMQFFGISTTAIRSLSLLFFLLTLPVLFKLAKEASNSNVALLTVALFSLSPFIMWYSTEARMYSLFAFATSLNNLYFLRMLRSNGGEGKEGYFFSTLMGFYTHYFFVFLIFTQGVFLFGRALLEIIKDKNKDYPKILEELRLSYEGKEVEKKQYFKLPREFIFLVFFASLFFIPWAFYFIKGGLAVNSQPLIPRPTSFNILQTFLVFLFGFQPQGIQSILISLWPLAVILLFFVFTQRKRITASPIEYFMIATFLPIVIIFLASFIKPIFLSRYLIFTTPTLFFIIAWLLLNYSRRISTYLITFLIIFMFSLLVYQNVSAQTPVKEDYRGVDEFLKIHATYRDIVAASAPFTIYPIEYSYTSQARLVTIPDWDRYTQGSIPPFSTANLEVQMNGYKGVYRNIFIVLSYDQGYQNKIQDYMDHHYKLELIKDFSPGLQVREYKLRY